MLDRLKASTMTSRIVGGVLVAGAVVLIALYSPDKPVPEKEPVVRPAKTAVVRTAGSVAARAYPGQVQASERVELSFRVSGPLIELKVKEGMKVAAGDVLAQIDPRDFRTRLAKIESSLDEENARLEAMRTGERVETIRMLESQVAAARSDYEDAEKNFARDTKLFEDEVISRRELDESKNRRNVAKERFDAAVQDLERGKAGARPEDIAAQEAKIRGLEANRQDARNAIDDTSLQAPFAGLVAKTYVDNFQEIQAKSPVLSLQDVSRVEVVADIPETVVAILKREYVAGLEVVFDSVPGRTFDAEVEEFAMEADRRTQTYAATVSLPAPDDVRILPGMSASVRIRLTEAFAAKDSGIPIAADAVLVDEAGDPHVWVVKDDWTVTRVRIEVEDMSGDRVLALGGISDGQRIVTAGVHFLVEGQKIRPLDEAGE